MSAAARPAPWPGLAGRSSRRPREWLPAALAASVVIAATVALLLVPLAFAYPAPRLHIALETGAALIGLLATAMVLRGWREGPRLDRLAIAAGLALMTATSVVLTLMLAVAPDSGPRSTIAISGTLVGSVLLGVGAFAPARRPAAPGRAVLGMCGIVVVSVAAVALPIELLLGAGPAPAPVPDMDLTRPQLGKPAEALALQLLTVVTFGVAAFGLTRRGVRTGDAFARRLGLAATFYVFAKVHYLLLPPMSAEMLPVGDVLRLLFCAVLLWAAIGELLGVLARRAAEGERRRIARDLHDGVAQELAFIRRRAARLAGQPDAADIVVAADRALLDSRWAIEHLARPPDEPLERVLARHAGVIAARTGVAVTFAASGSGSAEAGPEVREALARILGEAVANARHGHATRVHVELSADPLRLTVIDDGAGFDPARNGPGFGLGGMRERAALVGAQLRVRSGPGAGTEVAVELP